MRNIRPRLLGCLTALFIAACSLGQAPVQTRWNFTPLIQLFSVGYSPDGRLVAVGGSGGVNIYEASGLPYWCPPTTASISWRVAFSPDGNTLAIAGSNVGDAGIIELWDVKTQKLRFSLPTKASSYASIAFSPNSTTLLVGGSNADVTTQTTTGVLEEWQVSTGKLIGSPKPAGENVKSVAYSADGKIFASGETTASGTIVELWDASRGTLKSKLTPTGQQIIVTALAFSPDGKTLACGCSVSGSIAGATIQLLSTATGTMLNSFPGAGWTTISCLAYSPDGKLLADSGTSVSSGVGAFGTFGAAELRSSQGVLVKTLGECEGTASAVAFTNDGTSLAQVQTAFEEIYEYQYEEFVPTAGYLNLWNVEAQTSQVSISTGTASQTQATNTYGSITGGLTGFSADGKLVAGGPLLLSNSPAGGLVNQVPIWNAESGIPAGALNTKVNSGQYSTAFSPDGGLLAVAGTYYSGTNSTSGVLELWNPANDTSIASLATTVVFDGIVAFSPDGKYLACGGNTPSGSRVIELWDRSSLKLIGTMTPAANILNDFTFTPDSKELVDCGSAYNSTQNWGVVEVWSVATGQLSATLGTSEIQVYSVAVSPDGKTLAVGGDFFNNQHLWADRVELWDLTSEKLVATLATPQAQFVAPVSKVKYAKDGKTLFVCAQGIVLAFDTSTNKLDGYLLTGTQQVMNLSPDCSLTTSGAPYGRITIGEVPPVVSAPIAGLSFSPASVFNLDSATGTVTLVKPAPAGGVTVALQAITPDTLMNGLSVPATVTIPAGKRSAPFTVVTPLALVPSSIAFTAWSGTYSASGNLTVFCPNVVSITLSSTSVQGGASLTATVTIDRPAGYTSPTLTVTSDNSAVTIQGTPSFAYGKTTTTVHLVTTAVTAQQVVTLTAKCGSTTKTVKLTVKP